MEVIDGQWFMEGVDSTDPSCIHTSDGLLEVIEKVGFLPLFSNDVPGFSVENMTDTPFSVTIRISFPSLFLRMNTSLSDFFRPDPAR